MSSASTSFQTLQTRLYEELGFIRRQIMAYVGVSFALFL